MTGQAPGQARRCPRARRSTGPRGPRPRTSAAWSGYSGASDLDLRAVPQRGVEAGPPVGVAGRAGLVHQQQQAVPVAIDPQLDQPLHMARGLALLPERRPRPRPVGDPPVSQRPRHRGRIHPGQHQHLARGMILRDGGDQALRHHTSGVAGSKAIGVPPLQAGQSGLSKASEARGKAMSDSDLIKLYSGRILALAADIPHLGRLPAPDGTRQAPLAALRVDRDGGCGGDGRPDHRLRAGREGLRPGSGRGRGRRAAC